MVTRAARLRLVTPAPAKVQKRTYGRAPRSVPRLPVYASGMACPGCDSVRWDVRRVTAECATCGWVLPV